MLQSTRQETDEMFFQAGIGTAQISRAGLVVARLYHWIIASFTVAIVLLAAVNHAATWIIGVWLAAYGLYFVTRKALTRRGQRQFYHPAVQLARAQIGIVAVASLIYFLGVSAENAYLWLLFVFVLQIVSKHCPTPAIFICLAEVCLTLTILRLLAIGEAAAADPKLVISTELIAQCLWISILTFAIHYLVRNIDARQDTIAGYELVNALSGKLDTLTDAQAKWKAILDTCLQVAQGAQGSFWICDYKTQEVELLVESTPERTDGRSLCRAAILSPTRLPLGDDNVLARAVLAGKPCYYTVASESFLLQDGVTTKLPCPPVFRHLYSLLLIPVIAAPAQSGKTLALLCIGYDRPPRPRRVVNDYQNLLASMVYRIRPLLEFQQHLQELEALQAISRQVSQGVELNEVLDSMLDVTVTDLGFGFAIVHLVEPGEKIIRARRGRNVPDGWIQRAFLPLQENNIWAEVVATGKTEIIDGWDDRLHQKLYKRYSQRNMVRVFTPIKANGSSLPGAKPIGVVEAGYRKSQRAAIDEQQVAMLRPFVEQVVVAIEKAQLLERMEKQTEALTSLHRVSQSIAAARDRLHVWDEIGASAHRVLHADVVMLYPYDETEHTIQTPQIFGDVHGNRPLDYSGKETGILAKIVREQKPYYSAEAAKDPNLTHSQAEASPTTPRAKRRSFTQRQNIRSFAGLPLLAGEKIVGVMCVNYRRDRQFDEDEKQILELFAQQAAIAVNNAAINDLERRLYADQERSRLHVQLHELVAQHLPAIRLMAATAQEYLDYSPQQARERLDKIGAAAKAVLEQVDLKLLGLKPLRQGQLTIAVQDDAQFCRSSFGANIQVEVRLAEPLDVSNLEDIYLTIREALTNAARHAQASRVLVRLRTHGPCLYFIVRDDGCGFDVGRVSSGRNHGLDAMQQRMRLAGGRLYIRSVPGKGTIVRGSVQLRGAIHEQQ